MCCCISGEPVEDTTGRIKTFHGRQNFQRTMMWAPCANCTSLGWFCGQFIPLTCGFTQCMLRRKVLEYDMTKYSCFQGQFNFCCLSAGSCGEENCPTFCAFLEGCLCNCCAISASRAYVMEKYDLSSDPCDYRLIRLNNALQILACVCSVLAIFIDELRELAWIINRIADIVYQCISGCMTAQVAYEMDYQHGVYGDKPYPAAATGHTAARGGPIPVATAGAMKGDHHHQHHQQQPVVVAQEYEKPGQHHQHGTQFEY